jgi:HD-like signal output (HDOD) protein/ActR/RegA family two-component response regulator
MFVDDEMAVLEGLRLALRDRSVEWDMSFAHGGEEALTELERCPADVVVSDMRMPGMDGAELLSRIKARWPETVRLILSGQAEAEAVSRAVSVSHQLLSKPLRTEVLRDIVRRAVRIHALINRPETASVVERSGGLPELPETYGELIRVIQDERSSMADIAKVVERNPVVSAKTLQLVNSAYFGLSQDVGSVRSAVGLLGPHVLLGMALTSTVLDNYSQDIHLPGLMARTQEQALATCAAIRRMLPAGEIMDEAVTAALIHDLGTVLLARAEGSAFEDVLTALEKDPKSALALERERFGTDHAAVGAHLFSRWSLPLPIVEAVAFHHEPSLVPEPEIRLLAALHGADAFAESARQKCPPQTLVDVETLKRGALERAFSELCTGGA